MPSYSNLAQELADQVAALQAGGGGGSAPSGLTVSETVSGNPTLEGQHQFTLQPRSVDTLAFPVPTLEPTTPNSNLALDLMPLGSPGNNPTNGVCWADICAENVRDDKVSPVTTLRLANFTDHVEVGSRAYNAGTVKDIWLGPNQDGTSTGTAGEVPPMLKLLKGAPIGSLQIGLGGGTGVPNGYDVIIGGGPVSLTRTAGHIYISAGPGAPTGIPQFGGNNWAVIQWDSTNHKLWAYDSAGWKSVAFA